MATYDRDEFDGTIDPARVPVTELAAKLQAQFTGAGATPMTTALVTTELSTAAAPDGCLGPPPCAATFDEFVTAWYALSAKYVQPRVVKTKMCLGAPGFNFVVGCITASLPQKKVYETKCTWGATSASGASAKCKGYSGPPFYGCRAITTSCGSSCNTEAQEPANRYSSSPHTFCDGERIKLGEIEEAYKRGLRLEPGAVVFAIM